MLRREASIGRRAAMLLFSCSLMVAVSASAADSSFALGLKEFKQGRWAKAQKHLQSAVAAQPRNANVNALLGMSEYHLARYSEAEQHLGRALDLETSYAARTLYYRGLTEAKLGQPVKAEATFRALTSLYPNSSEARKLGVAFRDVRPAVLKRDAVLLTGTVISSELGYSSNPTQTSEGDSDAYLGVFASSSLQIPDTAWSVGGWLSLEKYLDDSDNDFATISGDLSRRHELTSADRLLGAVTADMSWFGGESYERTLGLLFVHTRRWSKAWQSELRLGLESVADLTDAGDADASVMSARLRLTKPFLSRTLLRRIRFELQMESEDNEIDWRGSSETSVGMECRLVPYGRSTLDLGVEYSSTSYDGEDPYDLIARDDTSFEFGAFLAVPVSRTTSLTGQLSHDMRDSSISYYDTDETVLVVGVLIFP